ncbi:MAG: hypothetical protein P8N14_11565 [Sulfitobacter sp.]|jgi:hypothetical protein|nr:hypothetical protein [Sulfitobacter sp.]
MSSILLTNPFPAQTQAPSSNVLQQFAAMTFGPAPVQQLQSAANAGDSKGFSGSGAGSSNQQENVALFQSKTTERWARPANATGGSVIGAQARESEEVNLFGINLPKVEMPNPLPTSPFLKGAEDSAA